MSDDGVMIRLDREHLAAKSTSTTDDGSEEYQVYSGVRRTIEEARIQVKTAVNTAMLLAYWEVGHQIVVAQGERAEYGKQLLFYLAQRLTAEFGKGFDESNLRNMRRFYLAFPIQETLSPELSWSHYLKLSRLDNQERRDFYTREAIESRWTVRQLERQIGSFYYERLLASPSSGRSRVRAEIETTEPRTPNDDSLKDPYVFEFLGMQDRKDYSETELESALMDKLQDFLLELGKGYAFVARQMRISSDNNHYYIDLVFYNYILKRFVLIDLKIGRLTHQDVGQVDSYRRIFDAKVKGDDDNPSIGILSCDEGDEVIAKYSVLADDVGLFASSYKLYLPTEEELKTELKRERQAIEAAHATAMEDTII